MNSGSFKNVINKMYLQIPNIYLYKQDLALNNLQWLIYHKTQQNKTKSPLSGDTTAHTSVMTSFNSSRFDLEYFLNLFFRIPYKFSIGFTSGLFSGQ